MSRSDTWLKRIAARRSRLPRIVYPPSLPILERKTDIVAAIRKHPVIVITGETGSGKTTQLPKMCLEAGRGLAGMIGCTQPRRIAATTVARRIAEEMGEDIGRSVGFHVRFDYQTHREAFIKIMTDGILLMEAQTDPLLRAYDTVIVDEAHERSLNIDFVLGILKTILAHRSDLRVVITSATIDTEKFSRAFGNAPIIEVSGRLYPVEVRYDPLDPKLEERGEITPVEAAVRAVENLEEMHERGDILIFMPTEQDIRETCSLLPGRFREKVAILPLFSRLSAADQQRVFRPVTMRKIVVATNVAETSITIPGIRFVIDTGLARIAQYNPRSRTAGLPVRPISKSSADQRKGRCGRVQNGVCIRLYGEDDYLARPLYTPPEILRSNLAGVILRMLALNLGDIEAFPFIDRPAQKSIRDGIETLLELGGIESEAKGERGPSHPWRLTERGRVMAQLPLDPRISRMILEAIKEGCLDEIVVIGAALSIQDPRERPAEKEAQADQAHAKFKDPVSDFASLLNLWRRYSVAGESPRMQNRQRRFCRDHFLSYRRMREWREIHDQIFAILAEQRLVTRRHAPPPKQGADLYTALHRSVLSGYLGQIAQKKEKNLYTATQGRQAMIFPGSGLFNHGGNWIVAAEMIETSRLFARTVANIESGWLEELGGNLCKHTYSAPHWEKERGEVVASETVTLFGLTIVAGRPVSFGRIDPDAAASIFIRSALVEGEVKRPLPFLIHNQSLIRKLEGFEEKIRRRDLLIDEEAMAQFYAQRLPVVFDIRTLQRLIRDRAGDAFLRMREEDILVKAPDLGEIALYPEAVSTGGWSLECRYRFNPGRADDGITLKVPVHAVPSIPAAGMDWEVPGLLKQKVMALLKGLPKEYRKRLLPLGHTGEVILKGIERQGSLPSALSRFIYERFGVDIPADRWPQEELDDHLKIRYIVTDEQDRELAAGRDIAVLRREFVHGRESQAFVEARRRWEKTALTAWDFGNLPDAVPLIEGNPSPHSPMLFPGLVAEGTKVAIRLFLNELEARRAHRKGVGALLALRCHDDLKQARKSIAPMGDLKLWASAFGGVKALETAILEKVTHDLFEADIRTRETFEALAARVRSRILPLGQVVLRMAGPPLKALYEATELIRSLEIANRGNGPVLAFLTELRDELARLLPSDFLIRYDEERLGH
ncbi:MAG: ATP-dependent RNA helicase HrpA, partial [Deltaproteobacteria bacterium]|nr:ATP-dependent RNA helicase HrpA [Deltaproteobacteria bacterium]